MFSRVCLFVFWNNNKINGNTVSLSFIFKNLILIIRKVNFHLSNTIIYISFIYSKTRFSCKEDSKKCTCFEELKGTRYIQGNVYFEIIVFSSLSPTDLRLEFVFICFTRALKAFYQISRGNGLDFMHFPKNLGLRLNFQKTESWFCGWRSNECNNINIFQSLETAYRLLLAKEKTWKRIFKPTANGPKTIQKNNSCHPKQQYIDCLMIYYAI